LIANAGILVSEVVLVARKSRTAVERWVYTDVGKFSGLIETMDEAIKFPIWTEKKGEMEEVVIAGQPATAPTSCTKTTSTVCR